METDYAAEQERCRDFLEKFSVSEGMEDVYPYVEMLQEVADRKRSEVVIKLDDVINFGDEGKPLVKSILNNTKRYVTLFSRAVDELMPSPTIPFGPSDSVIDVLLQQRLQQSASRADGTRAADNFPPELIRRYSLVFQPPRGSEHLPIRRVKAKHIGGLVVVQGIVTRVSEVRPLMVVATYSCDYCGSETYQEVLSRSFTPLLECQSQRCKAGGTPGQLFLQTRGSKFLPFQEVRIQEMSHQVPVGNIPRSMTVHLTSELVRRANPGDVVIVGGIFLPTPYTGFRALRAGLVTDTYLEATSFERVKHNYDEFQLTPQLLDAVERLKDSEADENGKNNLFSRLARSIAPEIYGMEDVKRALLLQMVGGVTRTMADGMRIRGDINICLVGDPGVAKSQLLKYISRIAPRAVYTTGKGSSGVGLTAAVTRDPVTSEMTLEGGALVLADNGVCCIDEFDKMDESDRTAIHEVMEQQTVSISKAGINTTLNARTAILAAANPAFGRYNLRRSMLQNINLPAALLSRFDLLFLLLDVPNQDADRLLADHVTQVHMMERVPESPDFVPVPIPVLRAYVAQARQVQPYVPANASVVDRIVRTYVTERDGQANKRGHGAMTGAPQYDDGADDMTYTTPRSLLAILRLAQAGARLRFSDEINDTDVEEAIRLIGSCRHSLLMSLGERAQVDPRSAVYTLICEKAQTEDGMVFVAYNEAQVAVLEKGYTQQQMDDAIDAYTKLGVFMLSADRSRINIISEF